MHPVRRLTLALALTAALVTGRVVVRAECCHGNTLHDGFRTAVAGLEREWILRVPFNAAGWSLSRVVVGNGLVVALSSDGGLHAIQTSSAAPTAASPAPGTLLWSRQLGRPGSAGQPPGVDPLLVALPRDFAVQGIDGRTGRTSWREADMFQATAAAAVIDGWVYVPTDSDRVMRYPLNPRDATVAGDPKPARTPERRGKGSAKGRLPEKPKVSGIGAGGHLSTPVLPLPDGVVWCTDGGTIVSLQATDLGWSRWQFDLGSPTTGPLAIQGRAMFATTADADLVRIDLKAAEGQGLRLAWMTPVEMRPEAGPFVVGDAVLVPLGESGIVAYGTEDGVFRWRSDVAGTIVASAGGRAWCLDRVGRLTALDAATGLPVARLCLGGFTVPVVNTVSDRLVLASPDGLVTSLAARTGTGITGPREPAAPGPAGPGATPR